ncbi:aspartate aminotransferase family protein [Lutibacter sp. HS1-25]|uniref:aspartate aminotransferase family protein n=1 Tax=Lutibacter sp. HS1-25 TaxID=2485000 RepID=UPI0010134A57|nr:aminotransferase class III-fold pyridoxal phosphate-dependent enzyme [Lutibacter sp. HS1-25]RXP55124.1 aspartate aminotransferase family protein [Lutibacter sp. HS1-25]
MKAAFFKHQAQTSPHPLALEISKASGSYVFDINGKPHLDFIAGVSANTLGHSHPKVSEAIKNQVDAYTHVMVYGEFIQKPPADLCKLLAKNLPENLNTVYLTNSGTEATEGSIKLAKRFTGRSEIISAKWGYHGNTQGSMSVCGAEEQNSAFRPLIPGIQFIEFNNLIDLEKITTKTAGVILETIQGGAGFIEPENNYLQKVKLACEKVGALLILDEIQTGVGRTGKFYGFQNYNVVPDIFVTGKGLGGGMPIGAFIASNELMSCLKQQPKLGHITTFGGHPVIAAAALATLTELFNSNLIEQTLEKEALIRQKLVHPLIKEIRGKGLMLAAMVESSEIASEVILKCLDKGLLLFWLLFEGKAIRITPPLTISNDEILEGCNIILDVLNDIAAKK